MKLYRFRTVPLSIIRSSSLYTLQWSMSYRFADSLRAGSRWNRVPPRFCTQAVCKSVWHTIAVFTVKNSWWCTEELSETWRVSLQETFEKLVHLVGFIVRIYHDARSHERKIFYRDPFIYYNPKFGHCETSKDSVRRHFQRLS